MTTKKLMICPYCGDTQSQTERCRACGGLFEPLSRQATHNAMGPWFIRDAARPFRPGCSYETLAKMIDRGQVAAQTILRGPTTRQFWAVARHVPGVAHLLGYCHSCDAKVAPSDHGCHACGVPFGAYLDRDSLGLPEVRPLPWEAGLDEPAARGEITGAAPQSAGRISRFASNDELFGRAAAPSPAQAGRPGLMGAAGPGPDDEATEILAQSLRRRVSAQRRTIQVLAMLLIVAAAGLGFLTLARGGDARRTAAVPAAQGPAAPVEAARPAAPAPPIESGAEVPAAPAQDAPAQTSSAPASSLDAPRSAAMELLQAAAREDRPLADRIADYERGLEGLIGIDPASAPVGLDDLVARVRRELERLRLKRDFFG
jgi:hypothetical protein